mmetsp:Transcript_11939/g.28105  ORF Transcript_11939/g.28105 Transcript_11939/m.28105 type:complete len:300 (-) Transcript_11939:941-1840(-)
MCLQALETQWTFARCVTETVCELAAEGWVAAQLRLVEEGVHDRRVSLDGAGCNAVAVQQRLVAGECCAFTSSSRSRLDGASCVDSKDNEHVDHLQNDQLGDERHGDRGAPCGQHDVVELPCVHKTHPRRKARQHSRPRGHADAEPRVETFLRRPVQRLKPLPSSVELDGLLHVPHLGRTLPNPSSPQRPSLARDHHFEEDRLCCLLPSNGVLRLGLVRRCRHPLDLDAPPCRLLCATTDEGEEHREEEAQRPGDEGSGDTEDDALLCGRRRTRVQVGESGKLRRHKDQEHTAELRPGRP